MSTRAITPEEVERITNLWHAGVGPDELHDALGWSEAEYERWEETGALPDEVMPRESETRQATINEQLVEAAEQEGIPLIVTLDQHPADAPLDNPFLAGVPLPPKPDGCPFEPECETCPAAADDDVCLPHERERRRMHPNDNLQTYTWLRESAHRHALINEEADGEANAFAEWYVQAKPYDEWCATRSTDLSVAYKAFQKERSERAASKGTT